MGINKPAITVTLNYIHARQALAAVGLDDRTDELTTITRDPDEFEDEAGEIALAIDCAQLTPQETITLLGECFTNHLAYTTVEIDIEGEYSSMSYMRLTPYDLFGGITVKPELVSKELNDRISNAQYVLSGREIPEKKV